MTDALPEIVPVRTGGVPARPAWYAPNAWRCRCGIGISAGTVSGGGLVAAERAAFAPPDACELYPQGAPRAPAMSVQRRVYPNREGVQRWRSRTGSGQTAPDGGERVRAVRSRRAAGQRRRRADHRADPARLRRPGAEQLLLSMGPARASPGSWTCRDGAHEARIRHLPLSSRLAGLSSPLGLGCLGGGCLRPGSDRMGVSASRIR